VAEDSIFHDDPYYKSESSLLELGFRNGPVPNGSVCSSPSASSLSRSQTFAHGSPVSSNPSLPSGELTRPDYAPSHRHSAIIAPSYRPTPEYDAVMRQKHRLLPATPSADLHSQSLRSLNISNAFAYRRPEALVYSQPEMRERGLYHPAYGPPAGPSSAPLGPGVPPMAGQASCAPGNGISHTVSTPELANTKQQQAGGAGQAGEVPGRPSRPPPPYPAPFRPATSTPDLVSHRQRGVGGSSPETVTRKVQLSVKTFQPDSSSVVRQSLQEASELLTHAARRAVPSKGTAFALPRRNTQRDQAPPLAPPPARESPRPKSFRHQKTPSNVTMLVHSSESEEEEEEEYPPELDIHIPGLNEDIDARLQAALASIPNKPPPEYPGPRSGSADRGPRAGHGAAGGPPPRAEQACLGGALLGPSISEPDLTSVKERVRKEPVKERPVSEMFSIEDSIVERECAQRTLERQMKLVDSMKRPLMMATLNGLYVTRMPAPENARCVRSVGPCDRRLGLRLEEEALFTEYERVPKKAAERSVTTAALPENAERNRFRDVVPYEDTRVELVPSKDNNMGYINASHVRVGPGGEERHYIATQGPLPNTCHDFWQMVWEQGVNVIAMVTAEEEGGRSKSHRYWPKLGSKHNSATHGKFKVTTKFRTDSGCYATTGLKVKHLLSGQERTVWHLQYTDWPEHGCPEYVQGFLSYLEEIQSVRRHTNSMLDTSKSLNPPVVVHCSAGVGRTGVVILTELMLSAMEHNEKVEVPVMLGWLRHQRMLMVQTMTQYKFVYQVLIQFLKSSRLI
uniref:Protein tyrosine phosphatase non-receptor type 14 n=1 Tax=Electrophorus electricus TaxID=8005 RepID=A0AAY5EWB0_ELEEL